MAGPWFTVHESDGEWKKLDQIWISNGKEDCRGEIQMRITLIEPDKFEQLTGLSSD